MFQFETWWDCLPAVFGRHIVAAQCLQWILLQGYAARVVHGVEVELRRIRDSASRSVWSDVWPYRLRPACPSHPRDCSVAHTKVLIWMWHSPLGLRQSPNSFCRPKFKVTVALLKIAQELILQLSCRFFKCTSILKVKFKFQLMFLEYSLFFYRISGTESTSCPNLTGAVCFQIFQKPLQPDMGHNSLANFQIEKKIGRGQFSEVYQARYLLGNTSVALKKVQVIRIELISFWWW